MTDILYWLGALTAIALAAAIIYPKLRQPKQDNYENLSDYL